MNKAITPGEPCGERVDTGLRKVACKFHFGLDCFTSVSQMKALVRPDPRDGTSVPWWHSPGSNEYNILRYSLDGSPARAAAALLDDGAAKLSSEELDRLQELINKARQEGLSR